MVFLVRGPARTENGSTPRKLWRAFRRTPTPPQVEGESAVLSIPASKFSAQAANHQVFGEIEEYDSSNDA